MAVFRHVWAERLGIDTLGRARASSLSNHRDGLSPVSINDNRPVAWVKMVPVDELEEHHNHSKWRRYLPTIAIAVLILAAVVYGLFRPAPEDAARARPIAFDLPLLTGGGSLSSDDLEGRIVVLNFWASWCAPCTREMPMLERTWQKYSDRGVTIVGIDVRDAPPDARAFVNEFDITYPIVRDEEEILVQRLGADPLPQTFFVGRDGHLVGNEVLGEMTEEELTARLDGLLEEST
jgi:cytochrome c biogenesis protein CcmG, thiol:disulfide interchange protein DsbE